MRNAGRLIAVNGIQLNVVVEGSGDPVLLLHGFPDSSDLWRTITPKLTGAGLQVIAPDLRGFGLSDAPPTVEPYALKHVTDDMIAMLDALGLRRVKLVGHDWGAVVGWVLAAERPDRVESLTAISVGHPRAYRAAGMEQKLRSTYVLFFQLRGVAETLLSARNFFLFRKLVREHPETAHWIEDLARPGRLTAGLSWYRANLWRLIKADLAPVSLPVMGIWSTGDVALTEDQMIQSALHVRGSWRYERLAGASHWIPLDAPERLAELLSDFFHSYPVLNR